MLKYPCLVLDHDDTVVASEATVNHPFFQDYLDLYRPGMTITYREYIEDCFEIGYGEMCRRRFAFTDEELKHEYAGWKEYIQHHIPSPYPGIDRIIQRQKALGGIVCVSSLSTREIIERDFLHHFGVLPDAIYDYDLPPHQRKPNPYALEEIMARFGLKPEELLMVDDMKLGYTMAKAVDVPTAFAGWSKAEFPELTSEMRGLCDYSFASAGKLEAFLFEEN